MEYVLDPSTGLYLGSSGGAITEDTYEQLMKKFVKKDKAKNKKNKGKNDLMDVGTFALIGSSAGPVGAAVGAVGAAAYKSIKGLIQNKNNERSDPLKWISLVSPVTALESMIADAFGVELWKSFMKYVGHPVADFFTKTVPGWWSHMFEGFMRSVGSPVASWFRNIPKVVSGWWSHSYEGFMRSVGSPVARWFRNIPRNAIGMFAGAYSGFMRHVGSPVASFFRNIRATVSKMFSGIGDTIVDKFKSVYNPIAKVWNKVTPGSGSDLPIIGRARGGWGTQSGRRKFADGGFVDGLGTQTSDSVPAMLSVDEFVTNAGAANQAGMGAILEGINSGFITTADLYSGLNRGMESTGGASSSSRSSSTSTINNITVHNPVAERASDSLSSRVQNLTYAGSR
jgi:hypothetical protein